MTPLRIWIAYAGIAAGMTVLLATFDGSRGLWGAAAASAICAAPLAVALHTSRVADTASDPRISAYRWLTTHVRRMMFRLGWCLAAGCAAYLAARPRLGVSYWLALLVLYQVGLVLGVTANAPGQPRADPTEGIPPNGSGRCL